MFGINLLIEFKEGSVKLGLNVSRLDYYDKIPLIYGSVSDIKDLTQSSSGGLLWDGIAIITANDLTVYSTTAQINTLLSSYIPITHESYNIGSSNVSFLIQDIFTLISK